MIQINTNPDKSISTSCRGTPMQLLNEAAAALANVAESVGAYLMAEENLTQTVAEAQVMSDVITLAMKRRAQEPVKTS